MKIATFFMFAGQAEEALRFYVNLLPNSSIESLDKYGANEQGAEGTVKSAVVLIAGARYRFFDSPVKHAFGFTPAISLFVDCDSKEQIEKFAGALVEGGHYLMGPANYGFSQWFCWLQDRWGISWQLNFP
jgi:predicted 3-demethylubiquinone-9 3-methyltransferase (glyoxalase superfamily)